MDPRPAGMRDLLKQLDYSESFPGEELREYQLSQLKALVRHALATVPHYAKSFAGLDADRLDWRTFASLPRLGRTELQAHFAALRSGNLPASHGRPTEGQSSGSTGTPVRFLRTPVTEFFWKVLTIREHRWHFAGKLAVIRVRVEDQSLPNWGPPMACLARRSRSARLH